MGRGAVAQQVEYPQKVPGWCNSTDCLTPGHGKRWQENPCQVIWRNTWNVLGKTLKKKAQQNVEKSKHVNSPTLSQMQKAVLVISCGNMTEMFATIAVAVEKKSVLQSHRMSQNGTEWHRMAIGGFHTIHVSRHFTPAIIVVRKMCSTTGECQSVITARLWSSKSQWLLVLGSCEGEREVKEPKGGECP